VSSRLPPRRRLDRLQAGFQLRQPHDLTHDHDPGRRSRASDGGAKVVSWTLRYHFLRATIVFATARDDADANRIRVIRAIPIANGSSTTRFREVVQKYFQCPFVDESDAIPSS
jgi:hypothetical protein